LYLSEGRIAVAESGIGGHADIAPHGENGLHTVLVGESLMREIDVTAATRRLVFGAS
jgi:indole-3-glycerol phosphate synthase